jgi:hypothetical protein
MNEAPSRTECAASPDCGADTDAMIAVPSSREIGGSKLATARQETDAVCFIIASTVITAIIFGLINLIVYFFEPPHIADAIVTAPLSPMNAAAHDSIIDGRIQY